MFLDTFSVCSREQFIQWAEALGDYQTPSWLGLPNSAETVLLTSLGMLSRSRERHYGIMDNIGNGGCRFWQPVQADSQPKSSGLVLGWRLLGTVLHS